MRNTEKIVRQPIFARGRNRRSGVRRRHNHSTNKPRMCVHSSRLRGLPLCASHSIPVSISRARSGCNLPTSQQSVVMLFIIDFASHTHVFRAILRHHNIIMREKSRDFFFWPLVCVLCHQVCNQWTRHPSDRASRRLP